MIINQQEKLEKIIEEYEEWLLKKANVQSISIGFLLDQDGVPTRKLCIGILVSEIVPKELLNKSDLIPDEIEGFPTDIMCFESEPC